MNGDEGQAMRVKRWNRLERGLEGDCSLLCRRSELAGETGAYRRDCLLEKRGGSFNY